MLVDDHRLFAEAVRTVLEARGYNVVAVSTTVASAIAALNEHRPELALVDLALPDGSGLEVGRAATEARLPTKVVALTASAEPDAVTDALAAGFHGYVLKDTPMPQLFNAITAILDGQMVVPQRLAQPSGDPLGGRDPHAALLTAQLTARERQVLTLLVEGASSNQIARRLAVTPNTVRTHVQSILTKLQVHSRLEAAAFAVRHSIVKLPGNGAAADLKRVTDLSRAPDLRRVGDKQTDGRPQTGGSLIRTT